MRIKKTSQTAPLTAQIVDGYSESTTDGYSCDYINDTLDWKYLDKKTGSNEITLPNSFNELMVFVDRTNNGNYYQFSIPKNILTSSFQYFVTGYNITPTMNCGACQIEVSLTKAKTSYVFANGENNITASTSIVVYYR